MEIMEERVEVWKIVESLRPRRDDRGSWVEVKWTGRSPSQGVTWRVMVQKHTVLGSLWHSLI